MKIWTSRYGFKGLNKPELVKVGIAQGVPRWPLKYELMANLLCLAPTTAMREMVREEYLPLYIERLEALGVGRVLAILEALAGDKNIALLCWEDLNKQGLWCHRRLFADWWFTQTGEKVEELERIVMQGGLL